MMLMKSFCFLFYLCFYSICSGLQAQNGRAAIDKILMTKSYDGSYIWRLKSTAENSGTSSEKKISPTKKRFFFGSMEETLNSLLYTDKESNRKFRRTIFTKHNWQRHRSSNRYFTELRNMPKSVILRGLGVQTLFVTLFSLLIVSYNTVVEMKKFPIPMPLLSFPALPFALTSSSLGLLLVFRTNAAYSRWKDARISWALISARAFDLMRQGMIWIPNPSIKSKLIRYTVAFAKVTKWHLGHQGNDRRLRGDLYSILTTPEIDRMLLSRNRVQWMLMKISEVMKEGELVPNVHCHIDKGLMEMTSAFSTCDRIFTTPIPLMYTRHTARFLLIWLLTVPMSLYHEFRKTQTLAVPFIIPLISFFNAIFLFGIEELGVQIEEPFSILPLANICNDIQYAGEDMLAEKGVSWFDSTEKLIEKNSNEKQIEKDKKFEVDRDVVKQLGPSAKDVFVYSKKGDNSINDKVAVSSLLNSRNSNSNNNINNSIPGFDPPSEGDVELAKVRKELEDAVSRNISSSSKRDLFIESRNKEDRKVEKVKRDTEKVKNDTVMDATVGDGDRSMNSEVFPSLK